MTRKFSSFLLPEAQFGGKIVSLDVPFDMRDDPEYKKGVYVTDPDSHKTKLVRYGKRDAGTDNKVGPKADPQSTKTPDVPEEPKKTSPKYWEIKDKLDTE
jgi:hypothetical protein